MKEWDKDQVNFLNGWTMTWRTNSSNKEVVVRFDKSLNQTYPSYSVNGGDFQLLKSPYYYQDLQIQTVSNDATFIYFGITSQSDSYNPDMNFRIKILWTHNYALMIHLHCDYKGQVCGLMGNYDGDPMNDWMLPNMTTIEIPLLDDGVSLPSYLESTALQTAAHTFGTTWNVDPSCSSRDWTPSICSPEQLSVIQSDQYCGIFKMYPFDTCYSWVR